MSEDEIKNANNRLLSYALPVAGLAPESRNVGLKQMKRWLYLLGCLASLGVFGHGMMYVTGPPMNRQYIRMKQAEARAEAIGSHVKLDFTGVPKFRPGADWHDTLTYERLGGLLGAACCFLGFFHETMKRKANHTPDGIHRPADGSPKPSV